MMETSTVAADTNERLIYTKLLQDKSKSIAVVFNKQKRLKLSIGSVFKICSMNERYPEEEVLFAYYENPIPQKVSIITPQQHRMIQDDLDENCSLLQHDPAFRLNDSSTKSPSKLIDTLYFINNIILIIYSIILTFHQYRVFPNYIKFSFPVYFLTNLLLLGGLFTSSFLGIYYYSNNPLTSLLNIYYGIIGFNIAATLFQIITSNFASIITIEIYIYLNSINGLTYGIYGSLLCFQVTAVILNYFLDVKIKKNLANKL